MVSSSFRSLPGYDPSIIGLNELSPGTIPFIRARRPCDWWEESQMDYFHLALPACHAHPRPPLARKSGRKTHGSSDSIRFSVARSVTGENSRKHLCLLFFGGAQRRWRKTPETIAALGFSAARSATVETMPNPRKIFDSNGNHLRNTSIMSLGALQD